MFNQFSNWVNRVKKKTLKTDIWTCCLSQIFLLYKILQKIFLQIKCIINLGIKQITSMKWLTTKLYRKLLNLIIYVHIVNLLQVTV